MIKRVFQVLFLLAVVYKFFSTTYGMMIDSYLLYQLRVSRLMLVPIKQNTDLLFIIGAIYLIVTATKEIINKIAEGGE